MRRVWVAAMIAVSGAGMVVACMGEDPDDAARGPGTSPTADSSAPDGGDGGDLAADAAPSIGCPLDCLPPAPEGWTGPSAVYDGPTAGTPSKCPPDYVQSEIVAHDDLQVPDARCSCDRFDAGGSCSVDLQFWQTVNDAGCNGSSSPNMGAQVPGQACADKGGNSHAMVRSAKFAPVACTYGPPSVDLPPVTFGKTAVACGLPVTSPACPGRADCTATPPLQEGFNRLCIHKDGDQLCPSLDYPRRFVSYASVEEGRGCSSCEGRSKGACGSKYRFTSDKECTNESEGNLDVGGCYKIVGTAVDLEGLGPINLGCVTTDGGAPIGTVTPSGAVTFCCNK